MARRRPGLTPDEVADEAGVPAWVLSSNRFGPAIADLEADGGPFNLDAVNNRRRQRRTAAEEWCAERGLSFCMTVLGWRLPSPHEAAAGLIKGPADP